MNSLRPQRLRHPAILIFLLGGFLGSGLNLALSAALHSWLGLNHYAAFFAGTMGNQLFHYLYYHLVHVNQEIKLRNSLLVLFAMYVLVAILAQAPLWFFLNVVGLKFITAVLSTIILLSLLNSLLIRISTFSSAQLAEVEYREMGETFYDDQTDAGKVGRFRAWFHRARYEELERWVAARYRPGMTIADLGCGNCWWNNSRLPVTGADINENMLRWAQAHGRVSEYRICTDLGNTGLPAAAFDIVIMSETLEHLLDVDRVLAEVRRILKPDGTFLITVPYDFFLGPFFILFNINCLYQGYVKGSRYHRYRCGHVNHFAKRHLRRVLAGQGFTVTNLSVINGLSLYAAARRTIAT
ncbi:MAG TPA: class I SAM-dependent methyltransferase [Phycisphaerae bacterium]|nr:class I SAM-dependent methyltransferase [Phycisphaerae bacterium]